MRKLEDNDAVVDKRNWWHMWCWCHIQSIKRQWPREISHGFSRYAMRIVIQGSSLDNNQQKIPAVWSQINFQSLHLKASHNYICTLTTLLLSSPRPHPTILLPSTLKLTFTSCLNNVRLLRKVRALRRGIQRSVTSLQTTSPLQLPPPHLHFLLKHEESGFCHKSSIWHESIWKSKLIDFRW